MDNFVHDTLCREYYSPRSGAHGSKCWLVGWLVGRVFKLQRTALTIFLIFCMELGIDKVNKVTEPDFRKKIFFSRKWGKRAKNSPKSFLFEVFSETALMILFFIAEEEDIIELHTCAKFQVRTNSGS